MSSFAIALDDDHFDDDIDFEEEDDDFDQLIPIVLSSLFPGSGNFDRGLDHYRLVNCEPEWVASIC